MSRCWRAPLHRLPILVFPGVATQPWRRSNPPVLETVTASKSVVRVAHLIDGGWIDRRENLFITGLKGLGKKVGLHAPLATKPAAMIAV